MKIRILVIIGAFGLLAATVMLFRFGREVAHQRVLQHRLLPPPSSASMSFH